MISIIKKINIIVMLLICAALLTSCSDKVTAEELLAQDHYSWTDYADRWFVWEDKTYEAVDYKNYIVRVFNSC